MEEAKRKKKSVMSDTPVQDPLKRKEYMTSIIRRENVNLLCSQKGSTKTKRDSLIARRTIDLC